MCVIVLVYTDYQNTSFTANVTCHIWLLTTSEACLKFTLGFKVVGEEGNVR